MRSRAQQLALVAAILMATLACADDQQSGWGGSWATQVSDKNSMLSRRSADVKPADQDDTQGRNYAVHEPIYSNDTTINAVIDNILNSRREGRNLGEYDQVYADGNIDQALMQGNDMQARNLIRDKLCGLGLMSCDVEEKRPYYSTIYAQGPPPSNSFGGGPYGPPRPMPPPAHYNSRPPPPSSINSFGPPRKVGYESSYQKPNYRPSGPAGNYNGPYLESPPPSAIGGATGNGGSFNKPPPGAIIYGSKPPGPVYSGNSDLPPYNFENSEKIQTAGSQHSNFYSQQSSSASASSSSSSNLVVGNVAGLSNAAALAANQQQHIHHHYHHVEGGADVAKVPSVPIPIGAGQTINTDFSALAQSSTAFTPQTQGGFTQSNAFNAGFNGASQGGLLSQGASSLNPSYKPNGDLYKPSSGLGGYSTGNGAGFEQGSETTNFGQNGFAPNGLSQGGFGQNGLAQGGFSQNGLSQGGFAQNGGNQQGFGQSASGSYHSTNPDYFKKELHNFGGLSSSNQLNGISGGYGGDQGKFQGGFDTSRQQIVDCQCVPFDQCPAADRIGRKEDLILAIDPRNLGKDIEALSDDVVGSANATVKAEAKKDETEAKKDDDETSKRTKRQADNDDSQADADLPLDAEGQRQGLAPIQAIQLLQRKILPTYGVSFGLPSPVGAYPVNAHGDFYPAKNPHFGAIGPDGLNLGLLNVNPLVSVQVSKTEYGDRVVKPLVNLHVTPNANILQKVGDLFKPRPEASYNTHYHHHEHFSGFEHDFDHDHHSEHHHPEHIITGPGPIEHYSASGPSSSYEMIPSQPIFEYHSGPALSPPISPPIHHHQHHEEHYDHHHAHHESHHESHASFGHTSFAQHQSTGSQYYPGTSGTSYPTTGNGFGQSGSSNGFGHTGYSGAGYEESQNVVSSGYGNGDGFYERSANVSAPFTFNGPTATGNNQNYNQNFAQYTDSGNRHGKKLGFNSLRPIPTQAPGAAEGSAYITFPKDRRRRSVEEDAEASQAKESVLARSIKLEQRAYYGNRPVEKTCRANEVCCRRPIRPPQQQPQFGRCGVRNAAGITGRIKNPVYVDGDSEFGEYPWHVAILKKDPKESIYACGGTLIDAQHVITAAHCIKSQNGFDLRARLGEWDVNHDVEFFPYIERDVVSVHIHPEYYAGTLDNDLAILKLDHPVDFSKNPHISAACLPEKFSDFTGARCWTTGWGKDAFGDQGKYQNILKEVDVPILSQQTCQTQLRQTRLGYNYKLNPGFVCAGGEEGKDACKGDGGGPLVCERNGAWNVVGVVSWGIGCGQVNVPGVYVRVAHYLDWIRQITQYYK